MRRHSEDREDDSYLNQLGWTRHPVPHDWDDPTEICAVVDPDVRLYDAAGRIQGCRPVWEQEP